MSFCTLGLSAEWAAHNIAVNSLWPRTTIATAAVANLFPKEILRASRTPEIVADAAYYIVNKRPKMTGNFFIDEDILRESGLTDFSVYAMDPIVPLMPDLFLDK
jgi:citronellol/citronellal dehydrogenase